MNLKRYFVLVVSVAFLSSCISYQDMAPVTRSSSELGLDESLQFDKNSQQIAAEIRKVFGAKKWKLVYEGKTRPKENYSGLENYNFQPFSNESVKIRDSAAYDKTLKFDIAPSYYLQAKTPTSGFSYGSAIFVAIYETSSEKTAVSIAASSGQYVEKSKLQSYINDIANSLK